MQNVTNVLVTELTALRDKKGTIAIEDLSGVLENVANAIGKGSSAVESFLHDEMLRIATHIEATRNEIAALVPQKNKEESTSSQLDAVIKATEEAAHTLMDAADEIQNVIGESGADEATKQKIMDIAARIYEACNFQDLTSQRITKVMKAFEFTEARIQKLIGLFGNDGTVDMKEFVKLAGDTRPDAHLLNGPQMPGEAPSQADIDALFGNTK